MDNKNWASHAEFAITLIGGFYTLDRKIERQDERIDKTYEMFYEVQK